MEQVGRFKVLRRLGGGGFGEVWLGLDETIKREVAIKVFKPKDENLIEFATSSDTEGLDVLRARFVNEARILASLEEEPHVVNVMEFGELEDGSPYYVMPYLHQSLSDLLGKDVFDVAAVGELPEAERPRSIPLEQALTYLEQILMGLSVAHKQGLVHRDIKPDNILLSDQKLDDDLLRSQWLLYRGSSVVIQAVVAGLKPIYLHRADEDYISKLSLDNSSWATLSFRKLLDSQEFRDLFVSRFSDYLYVTYHPVTVQSQIQLFKDKINFKMPGGDGFKPHQDSQAGWEVYATYFINVMVCLDEATIENGCLELASRPAEITETELMGKEWTPLSEEETAMIDFKPYPTKPGDVIYFDSYAPHKSAQNYTDKPRRLYFSTYNRLSEGNHLETYYVDKRKNFPPDVEREVDKNYVYRV